MKMPAITHRKYKVFLACVALGAAGCEKKLFYDTIPIDGHLETPRGRFNFEHISQLDLLDSVELHLQGTSASIRHNYIFVDTGTEVIFFTPRSSGQNLLIAHDQRGSTVKLDLKKAFYALTMPEQRFHWDLPAWQIDKRSTFKSLGMRRKDAPYYYAPFEIPPIFEIEKLASSDQKYRYYLPFEINENNYLMDVTIEFVENHDYHFRFGGPGTH